MALQTRQYGTWHSPISPQMLGSMLRLTDVQWDDETGALVWLEGRGKQGVLVTQVIPDAPRDLTEGDTAVSGRVGYGGGEFTVRGGSVYFAANGSLHRQSLSGGQAHSLTPAFGAAAAPAISHDGKWVVYVYSYQRKDGLALVDTAGQLWPAKLVTDTDFVMQPVWSPDDTQIAYIAWDHPQMPWDGTELRLAKLAYDGSGVPTLAAIRTVAGDTQTAIFQPQFSPDGRYLAYISDASGYGQLYVYDLASEMQVMLTDAPAEHGTPAWVQGLRRYAWSPDSAALYYVRSAGGFDSLWRCELAAGANTPVEGLSAYSVLRQLATAPDGSIALLASSPTVPERVISLDPHAGVTTIHRRSSTENVPEEQLAQASAIQWVGHDGEPVYGLFYAPTSTRYAGAGAPPLIVLAHGGPTSQALPGYDARSQFFATRGFAVLHVNYRGSTGYGKAYMNTLRGAWGIYDVEDCATGAAYLAAEGLADANKLVIMGGSAGGFTVLQSLIEKPGFYKAGVCMFGVSNQFLLVQDTHKFEERYSDSLLGPLPEAAEVYRARSPYYHASKIVDPVAVFQGEDDQVVPKNQSDSIVDSLRARGVPHVYHVYPGEGHGFRKPESIESFYKNVLDFLMLHVIYA